MGDRQARPPVPIPFSSPCGVANPRESSRRMTIAPQLSPPTDTAAADRALAAREAELERREVALLEAEQARADRSAAFALASSVQAELEERLQEVELRERELEQARSSFEWQRDRLGAGRGGVAP